MPEIQIPNIVLVALQVILAFMGAFLLAMWLSLIIWTFRDVRSRSRDIFAILLATLMVVIFGPLGLLLYFLLRPSTTLAELYERSLEEEALLQDLEERVVCPGCRRKIESDWMVCPDCHAILKKRCVNCGRLLHLRWNMCPYCVTAALDEVAGDGRDRTPFYARPVAQPAERNWEEPMVSEESVSYPPPVTQAADLPPNPEVSVATAEPVSAEVELPEPTPQA
jgi:RNA polymerase subunit RPABC4/transcription elongation factor Spt4